MKIIKTKTTYLQMTGPPKFSLEAPRDDLQIERLTPPCDETYCQIYREVGKPYNWIDRLAISQEELLKIIHDPLVEIFILTAADQQAGLGELDRRVGGEVQVAYFGLTPNFIGQGLGKYFLNQMLHAAWSPKPLANQETEDNSLLNIPNRVWLHTCDLDHQAALPNYQKAGLTIYDEKIIEQPIPK